MWWKAHALPLRRGALAPTLCDCPGLFLACRSPPFPLRRAGQWCSWLINWCESCCAATPLASLPNGMLVICVLIVMGTCVLAAGRVKSLGSFHGRNKLWGKQWGKSEPGCTGGYPMCMHVCLHICLKKLFSQWTCQPWGAWEPSKVLLRNWYSNRLRGHPYHKKKVKRVLERCLLEIYCSLLPCMCAGLSDP